MSTDRPESTLEASVSDADALVRQSGRPGPQRQQIKHGSTYGYRAHLKRQQMPCELCRAHEAARRARYPRKPVTRVATSTQSG